MIKQEGDLRGTHGLIVGGGGGGEACVLYFENKQGRKRAESFLPIQAQLGNACAFNGHQHYY